MEINGNDTNERIVTFIMKKKKKKTSISFAETGFYHNAMRCLKIELSIAFDKHYKQSLKTDFTYFK